MIEKEMTPLEIVEKFPETERIFHEYDDFIGECLLCNYLFDSINDIAEKHKIDVNEMIERLNQGVSKNS